MEESYEMKFDDLLFYCQITKTEKDEIR